MNWFKHDIGSLEDDRLSFLVDRYGSDGYAVFFLIVEELYRNGGNPIGSLSLSKIAKQLSLGKERVLEIAEYACSDECEGLLEKDGRKYSSERVRSAIEDKDRKVKQTKEAVRKRWENYYKKMNANADALRTYNERIADVEQAQNKRKTDVIQIREDKRRGDEIRVDKNDKSSSDEESLSLREELSSLRSEISSDKTSSLHSDVSPELSAKLQRSGTDNLSEPIFMTIRSVNGEDVPILEEDIAKWSAAYPAVDVRTEVRQAGAWCDANPRNRKTSKGMERFLVNWLSRSQDRAARSRNEPTSNGFIKGTDIPMTPRADGMDPDRFKGKDFNQIFEETYGYRNGRKVPREGKA